VSSQTGGHWISKWPGEDLSVDFDYGHPVAPNSPKEKFKGKLVKLEVKCFKKGPQKSRKVLN
jgi:hypothetical protein